MHTQKHEKYPNNLKLLRVYRDLSQQALATAAACSQTSVSQMENGVRSIPVRLRENFASALRVRIEMIEGPVTLIPKDWDRLVSDVRLPVLVEEMLTWDSRRLSQAVHQIAENQKVHNFAL